MPLLPSNWQSWGCCCEATSTCRCCPAIGSHHIVAVKQLQRLLLPSNWQSWGCCCEATSTCCCCPAIGSHHIVAVKQLQRLLLPSNWQSWGCCCEATSTCHCCPAIGSHHIVAVKQLQRLLLPSNWQSWGCCCEATSTCRCCPAICSHHIVAVKQLQRLLLPSNWQSPYCCCELLAFSTAITLFNCELFAGVAFSSKDCSWQRCDPDAGIQMLKAWWTTNASAAWLQLTTCCDSRLAFQRATCFACHTSQLEGFDVLVYDLHGFGVGLMDRVLLKRGWMSLCQQPCICNQHSLSTLSESTQCLQSTQV